MSDRSQNSGCTALCSAFMLASLIATGTASADCPAGPPVNASDGNSCGVVQINWPMVSAAIGYDIVRNTSPTPSGGQTLASAHPTTLFIDNTAAPQATYYYFIRPVVVANPFTCPSGLGTFGPPDSGWAAGQIPAISSIGPIVEVLGCDPVINFLTVNRGLVQIFRSTPPSTDFNDAVLLETFPSIQQPTEVTFIDSLAPVGDLVYWIRRINACGQAVSGGYEVTYEFPAPAPPPANLSATDGTLCGAIDISWTASVLAQSYTITVRQQVGFPVETVTIPVTLPLPPDSVLTYTFTEPQPIMVPAPIRNIEVYGTNVCGQSSTVSDPGSAAFNATFVPASSVAVDVGEPATLSISIGNPGTFQWFHDGVPILNGGRFSGADTTSLTIDPTTSADDGEYTVQGQTECGPVASTAGILAVRTEGGSACAADFDDNGTVAVPDIFAFLSAWFAGCP